METEIRQLLRDKAADVGLDHVLPRSTLDRARRRRVMIGAGSAGALAAVVVGAVITVGTLTGTRAIEYTGPTIEPRTKTSVTIGGMPSEIVSGFGSIWVDAHDQIVRIDPRSAKIVARIEMVGDARRTGNFTERDVYYLGQRGLTAGEGYVWAVGTSFGTQFSGQASTLDGGSSGDVQAGPSTSASFSVQAQPLRPGESPTIRAGSEQLPPPPTSTPDPRVPSSWSLLRIDPKTNGWKRISMVETRNPAGMVAGGGALWVAGEGFPEAGAVYRIDPATGRITQTIELQGAPTGIAFVDGAVWVPVMGNGLDAGSVVKIDPRENRIGQRVRIPRAFILEGIAGADHALWVGVALDEGNDERSDAVVRIDTTSGRLVDVISAPQLPVHLAVESGSMWFLGQNRDQVFRIDVATDLLDGRLQVQPHPQAIVAEGARLWVLREPDGSVTRFEF
ncbi:MAG: hypothetical protein WEB06_20730 [Actinomycetota bacterium]